MKIQDILHTTKHRPWKIPGSSWKFYQEWNKAIFLHWPVELYELKKFVPKELEIDIFEGTPWVSVVAFTMENIRPRYIPSFAPISNFNEINIRTYVKANNKTGVYFLSIEGGKKLSCKIARKISGLPYRYSKMRRSENTFESYNLEFRDKLNIKYMPGNMNKEKSKLDNWLTERYALFQDTDEAMNEFEIHHLEWPIRDIDIPHFELKYNRFENLLQNKPLKMHYSEGVKVIAWGRTEI